MAGETRYYELLRILKILKENGVDIDKIPISETNDGIRRYMSLSEISQKGIDINKIISSNKLNPDYPIGEDMWFFGLRTFNKEDNEDYQKVRSDETKTEASKEESRDSKTEKSKEKVKDSETEEGKEKARDSETDVGRFIRVLQVLEEKGIKDYTIYKSDPMDRRKRKYVYLNDIVLNAIDEGKIKREDKDKFYEDNNLTKGYHYGEILDGIRQRKLDMTPEQEKFLENREIFKVKPNKIRSRKTKKNKGMQGFSVIKINTDERKMEKQQEKKATKPKREIKERQPLIEENNDDDLANKEGKEFINILKILDKYGINKISRFKAGKQNKRMHKYASLEDTVLRNSSEIETYKFFAETGLDRKYPFGETLDKIIEGKINVSKSQREFLEEKGIFAKVNNTNNKKKDNSLEEQRRLEQIQKEENALKEIIRRAINSGKNIRQIMKVKSGGISLFAAQVGNGKNPDVIYHTTEGDDPIIVYNLLKSQHSIRTRIPKERIEQVRMELVKEEQLAAMQGGER